MPIHNLIIASLIGVVFYAGLHFLTHYLFNTKSRLSNKLYLYFSLICFAEIIFISAELIASYLYHPESYVLAYQWRLTGILLVCAIWPWLISSYTHVGSRIFIWSMTAYALVQLIPNILRPFGSIFDVLPTLFVYHFPWNETISFHEAYPMNAYSRLVWFGLLVLIFYTFYAGYQQYRAGFKRKAVMLITAMTVYSVFIIETLIVRMGLLDFIFLAPFGFPAFIVIMGISLHREMRRQVKHVVDIIDHVPSIVYVKNKNNQYMMVNRYFESVFNISSQDAIGKSDSELFRKESAIACNESDNQAFDKNQPVEAEENILHPDGSTHTYHSVKFPLQNENDEVYAVCGISTDITEWKSVSKQFIQSESKYRSLFSTAGDAIFLMQGETFIDCNPKALEMFGGNRADIIGKTPLDLSTETQYDGSESAVKAKELIDNALLGEAQFFEWRLRRFDGIVLDAEARMNRIEIDGQFCSQIVVRDITKRKRGEDALRKLAVDVGSMSGDIFYQKIATQLSELFKVKYAFISLLDKDDPRRATTIAFSVDGIISDNLSYYFSGCPCEQVIGKQTYSCTDDVTAIFPNSKMMQNMNVVGYIGSPLYGANGEALGNIGLMDVKPIVDLEQIQPILEIFASRASTEILREQTELRIHRMAYKDYLTGLANRAALHDYISSQLNNCEQDNVTGAMLLIDLDHFKIINDALSHAVGDQVLKLVADRLQTIFKQGVHLARIGGDEFTAISTNIDHIPYALFKRNILNLAKSIVTELRQPLYIDERVLNIGASVGVILFPEQADTELDIMRRADMALYEAKNNGRGNVQFYDPDMQVLADKRLQIERGLRDAIEKQQLEVYFQPQFNLKNDITGAEALLRWHHPVLGDVAPEIFIPVAEETGLIHAIGEWVIRDVCQKINQWHDDGLTFNGYIAINVSAWQFSNADFVTQVIDMLTEYHIDSKQIVLEVTETALLRDVQDTKTKLSNFRATGVRVALDDFGTGYSSLAYLKDMPMDILKIDKAFIQELSASNAHPLVETIIDMGQHMQLDIIAEGVETKEQQSILAKLGCGVFQGFYFSQPLSSQVFSDSLKSA